MHYDGEERRRYPRSRRGFAVLADEGPGVLNHIDNISGNGILCHTMRPIPLMTRMSIVLEIPKADETRRMECEGIVVRCDPDEMGDDHFKVAILFTKMDDEDHHAVVSFVDHDLRNGHA